VTVRYFLPQSLADGSLRLTVLNDAGEEVVSLSNGALGAAAGFHRANWDLRGAGVKPLPLPGADPEEPVKEARGPLVPPGRYTIRLQGPGVDLDRGLEVRADPRVDVPAAGLIRQYEVGRRIMDEPTRVRDAILRLRGLRERAGRWQNGSGRGNDGIREGAATILEQLDSIERRLTQPDMKDDTDRLKVPAGLDMKLGALSDLLDAIDAAPTAATEAVLDELAERARSAIQDLNGLTEGPVAELDRRIHQSGVPIVGG
ncbi:MAG: hypothetical protein ACREQM_19455, partial [Candidatus Dormibacteraceae bacterium]